MSKNRIYQPIKTIFKFLIPATAIVTTSLFIFMQQETLKSVLVSTETTKYEAINIFMVETRSDKLYITAREACSLESAASQNPLGNLTMYKIGKSYARDDDYINNLLINHPNIKFAALNVDEIFEETPLYKLISDGAINKSRFPLEHWSDAVRLALLWKEGGIYLDTDTIVVKPLVNLTNSVALESDIAANGFMAFQKSSTFLLSYMTEFAVRYNGQIWGAQGPVMITKILKQYCDVANLTTVINQPSRCNGIDILPSDKLFPIRWQDWAKLFQKSEMSKVNYANSYTVHMFNSQSKKRLAKIGDGSLIEKLFTKYCPNIYEMIKDTKFI